MNEKYKSHQQKDSQSYLQLYLLNSSNKIYIVFWSSHKSQFADFVFPFTAENPQNREKWDGFHSFGNWRSTEQLPSAHPFNFLLNAPNCESVTGFKSEALFFHFAIRVKCAVECIYAHTVAVFICADFVSEIGCGHSDHKLPVSGILNDFDLVALPIYELFSWKNRVIATHSLSDTYYTVINHCCNAVGSVYFCRYFFKIIVWDLLSPWQIN